jgi:hypothetical protein
VWRRANGGGAAPPAAIIVVVLRLRCLLQTKVVVGGLFHLLLTHPLCIDTCAAAAWYTCGALVPAASMVCLMVCMT